MEVVYFMGKTYLTWSYKTEFLSSIRIMAKMIMNGLWKIGLATFPHGNFMFQISSNMSVKVLYISRMF